MTTKSVSNDINKPTKKKEEDKATKNTRSKCKNIQGGVMVQRYFKKLAIVLAPAVDAQTSGGLGMRACREPRE